MFLVMALEKKIKNYSCLTKRELQEALGLDISDDEDIRSQPYILLSERDHEILAWAQNTQRSDRFSGCLFKQTCQGDERWRWFQCQWSWLRNFKTIKLLSLEEAEWQMLLWWDLKFKKIIFFFSIQNGELGTAWIDYGSKTTRTQRIFKTGKVGSSWADKRIFEQSQEHSQLKISRHRCSRQLMPTRYVRPKSERNEEMKNREEKSRRCLGWEG